MGSRLAACLVSLTALTSSLGAQVALGPRAKAPAPLGWTRTWTVDENGTGDTTSIQEAIDWAGDGDLVRILPGTYVGDLLLDAKGLTFFADLGPKPLVDGEVSVRNLDADQVAVFRNLEISPSSVGSNPRTLFEGLDCRGSIWFEDLLLKGGGAQSDLLGVSFCDNVVLVRSQVATPAVPPPISLGIGLPSMPDQRKALLAQGSVVSVYESTLYGPLGSGIIHPGGEDNQNGGTAARFKDSTGFLMGSTFVGGHAGNFLGTCSAWGGFVTCAEPGRGGHGISVANSDVEILDCSFQGGPGSPGGTVSCAVGSCNAASGQSGRTIVGFPTNTNIPTRSYAIDGAAPVGGTYRLTASGQPGEMLFSVFSSLPDHVDTPLYQGVQQNAFPVTLIAEGTLDATGQLVKDVPVPAVPQLSGFDLSFGQGLFFDAMGNAFLGSGSVLITYLP